MSLQKRLSQLSVVILLFSVLAVAFHYHPDFGDHPTCPICKTAQSLSSLESPAPPAFSHKACALNHALVAMELPTPLLLNAQETVNRWSAPGSENCRPLVANRIAASRASPAVAPLTQTPV